MRPLSTSELLGAWEAGWGRPPVQRALALLAPACPDTPAAELARLSIGQRDGRLLTLREWTFGPQLSSLATCPGCGQVLELSFAVSDIRAAAPGVDLTVDLAGYQATFRLPNSLDVAAVQGVGTVEAGRRLLLERCLVSAGKEGQDLTAADLPEEVVAAVAARMAEADPQADMRLALACPNCGREWQAGLDLVAFFWAEVNTWALRLLREVHALASAYGWSESEILAMSPMRRQIYLDMVGR